MNLSILFSLKHSVYLRAPVVIIDIHWQFLRRRTDQPLHFGVVERSRHGYNFQIDQAVDVSGVIVRHAVIETDRVELAIREPADPRYIDHSQPDLVKVVRDRRCFVSRHVIKHRERHSLLYGYARKAERRRVHRFAVFGVEVSERHNSAPSVLPDTVVVRICDVVRLCKTPDRVCRQASRVYDLACYVVVLSGDEVRDEALVIPKYDLIIDRIEVYKQRVLIGYILYNIDLFDLGDVVRELVGVPPDEYVRHEAQLRRKTIRVRARRNPRDDHDKEVARKYSRPRRVEAYARKLEALGSADTLIDDLAR